ncbi:MAG: NmrA/HSCARG family protein [Pseudonocardia sp.]|nr:NmrA/HSCARG family protein [Pseudonocardia sp.]
MPDRPILVLGATGGQGGAVVDALLARAAKVRALVRDPRTGSAQRLANHGLEVVAGSLNDEKSLAAAMHAVAGVFAMTTPFEDGVRAELEQGRAILAAAHRAQVPHLVFSSVAGANQRSGVPHFDSKAAIESELIVGGVAHTILGPTYFFDNALAGADRIRDGMLDLPLPPDRPLQQLARPDLGAFAAEVLLSPASYVGQRIELASDAPTPADMAHALGVAVGRPVRHHRTRLEAIGSPDMRAMWEFLNGPGYQVDLPALHAAHPEISWTRFATWAARTFGPPHEREDRQ